MVDRVNFDALVERAMQIDGRSHMRPVVEKELLHYDIMFALDQAGLLKSLTFQGGTALRLCYGSSRFSEDLDFVGGRDFSASFLLEMKSCLEKYLNVRYGLTVVVKEPKEMLDEPDYRDLKIDKWRLSIMTAAARKDLPHQKIKIEVGNIPSYARVPRSMVMNYDFLPDGYGDILIMTESMDEIMADKLVSLVNCQHHIRHRDIWDLNWLKQRGTLIAPKFVQAKISDYHIGDYCLRLDTLLYKIDEIIMGKAFYQEMSRFIPLEVQQRTLLKKEFKEYLLAVIKELLLDVRALIV